MAQRVGGARKPLSLLVAGMGRAAAPLLRRSSRRAILPLQGELALAGLASSVDVHLDAHGIPHVRAEHDADAFRVQGFLHARDRYFQMDMMRRVLRGGLSEVVGERPLGKVGFLGRKTLPPFGKVATTVDSDRLLRVFDLARAAERTWEEGGADGRALLGAYVEGVNACVARLQAEGRKPLEHRLLKLPLEPWTPADSILAAKGMALGLAFKWRAAPVCTALAEQLQNAPEHLDQILPLVPGHAAFAHTRCVTEGLADALDFLPPAPLAGSNAWMVAGGRSASGKPIVASDPHLDFGLPSIWYLASLHADAYKAVGCSLPGLPGIVIGRTPTTAWALTNGMLDDCDLWVEELDDAAENYKVDEVWCPLEVEDVAIKRKGAAPVPFQLRRTHRGPLFSDAFVTYEGPAFSMRMALHEPSQDLEAFLGLGRARTVAEGLEAARRYGSPAQNLLVADTHGAASYQFMGQVPMRSVDVHPGLPRDGTTRAADWTGWVPREQLPARRLAPGDDVVSANHPPVDGSYPHYLSHLYEPDYRAERIAALLHGRDGLTTADMVAMHADSQNAALGRFRRAVLDPYLADATARKPAYAALADALLAWEGGERAADRGGVPWHLLYHHLVRRTFGPRLGPDLLNHWMGVLNLVDFALLAAFESDESVWAPPAARAGLLALALDDTAKDLARRGLAPDATWGSWHTLTLSHPAGSAPLLGAAFQRGPFPADGSPFSVVSGQYAHTRPGPVIAGQSYRQVVDLGDLDAAGMITFGGQSGHIGSPHYDDLTPIWLKYGSVPMRLETPPAQADVVRFVRG